MQLCQHSNNMGTTMKLMTSIDCSGPSLILERDQQSWKSATKPEQCSRTPIIFVISILTPWQWYPKPIMNRHAVNCPTIERKPERALKGLAAVVTKNTRPDTVSHWYNAVRRVTQTEDEVALDRRDIDLQTRNCGRGQLDEPFRRYNANMIFNLDPMKWFLFTQKSRLPRTTCAWRTLLGFARSVSPNGSPSGWSPRQHTPRKQSWCTLVSTLNP